MVYHLKKIKLVSYKKLYKDVEKETYYLYLFFKLRN